MGVSIKDKPDDKLFIAQKHCIRILFGDLDVYLEKRKLLFKENIYFFYSILYNTRKL